MGRLISLILCTGLYVWIISNQNHPAGNRLESPIQMLTAKISAQETARIPFILEGSPLNLDYSLGSDHATTTFVVFIDLLCRGCRKAEKVFKTLLAEFPDDVRLVVKNYPLDRQCNKAVPSQIHDESCKMAEAARCAGEQGLFWSFIDLAFQHQGESKAGEWEKWSRDIGADSAELSNCLISGRQSQKVFEDIALGSKVGVRRTPAVFVDGQELYGNLTLAQLSKFVESRKQR